MSGTSSLADQPQPGQHGSRQADVTPGDIAVGVVIGRSSEYFDFFVYGIASVLVFPAIVFPFEPRLEATLLSFVVFSFAFIARPIGTVLSMMVQRRWSRGVKLTVALFVLGTSTAGIAFLPDFETAGYASVVLLALFRIGQGLGLGGSWDGLPSLLALSAPRERRGWYAMLGQLGAPVGFLLATGLFAYLYSNLSQADFLAWGWRYPFFVAFALNVVALFARLRLVVSAEYSELLTTRELEPSPVLGVIRTHASSLLIGAFAALASYALFHLVTVFPLSWITLYTTQSVVAFLQMQMIGAVLAAGSMFVSGYVADRFGRRGTLAVLATLIAIFSAFAPMLLASGTGGQTTFVFLGFILLGLSYGQSSGTVTSSLLARDRYVGAALTADLAWLIGAAFAPLVALWLSSRFGIGAVTFYLLSGAGCTLAALTVSRRLEARG